MVLVMALLVVVGGVSVPLIQSMMSDAYVQNAQDLVRGRWAEMRLHAMNEGRPYRFAYRENTGSFRIAPESPDFWGEAGGSSNNTTDAWVLESELPRDILFSQPGNAAAASATSQGWTRALTFLPDGTAREDVVVAFGKAGARALTLRVQGAVGAVTSGESPAEGEPK
jgi:hypothetical protein